MVLAHCDARDSVAAAAESVCWVAVLISCLVSLDAGIFGRGGRVEGWGRVPKPVLANVCVRVYASVSFNNMPFMLDGARDCGNACCAAAAVACYKQQQKEGGGGACFAAALALIDLGAGAALAAQLSLAMQRGGMLHDC